MLKRLMTLITSRMWGDDMVIVNEDKSVYATRGDTVLFTVSADIDGERVTFAPGDVVRIKVFEKKNANNVVLQKDFPIEVESDLATIYLTGKETKIGGIINKPVDYWYEVELNPFTEPQTIIGYDEDGAKIFKLFPEGKDVEEDIYEPTEEDIPVVDEELDLLSPRPVQNRAIARRIAQLAGDISKVQKADGVSYDNTQSGIDADTLQKAIDLLATILTVGKLDVDFTVEKYSPRMSLVNTENARVGEIHFSNQGNLILSSKMDNDNLVGIWVKPETEAAQDYLDLGTYINGDFTRYPIFGTYNKPRGKYEGTGSATTRIVTIGGIGTALKISTTKGMAIVTGAGAICKKYSSTEVYGLSAAECNFEDGTLTLTTADDVVNGVRDYYYEVL